MTDALMRARELTKSAKVGLAKITKAQEKMGETRTEEADKFREKNVEEIVA